MSKQIERKITPELALRAGRGDLEALEQYIRLKTGRGPHSRIPPLMGGFSRWDWSTKGQWRMWPDGTLELLSRHPAEGGARGEISHLYKHRHKPGSERFHLGFSGMKPKGEPRSRGRGYDETAKRSFDDEFRLGMRWGQQVKGCLAVPQGKRAAKKKARRNAR